MFDTVRSEVDNVYAEGVRDNTRTKVIGMSTIARYGKEARVWGRTGSELLRFVEQYLEKGMELDQFRAASGDTHPLFCSVSSRFKLDHIFLIAANQLIPSSNLKRVVIIMDGLF